MYCDEHETNLCCSLNQQDGLKVDKATLLKDAYEKLQTMKDDYHKGYETAITSTQSFLDRLDGCPREVKEALHRHLKNTLHTNLHRCSSTAADSATFPAPVGGGESSSDSCSPQPLRSAWLEVRVAQATPDCGLDSRCVPSQSSAKSCGKLLLAPLSVQRQSVQRDSVQRESFRLESLQRESVRRESGLVAAELGQQLSGSDTRLPDAVFAVAGGGVAAAAARAQGSSPSRTVAQVAPLPTQRRSGSGDTPRGVGSRRSPNPRRSSNPSPHCASSTCTSTCISTSTPTSTPTSISTSTPLHSAAWRFGDSHRADSPRPLRKDLHLIGGLSGLSYPQQSSYPGFTYPPGSTPKISPYVTPYAPQNPLYLGSTPSGLVYGVPDIVYSGSRLAAATPPYPALHPLSAHTPARFGGPSRADDSGYISPGVPTPQTPSGGGYGYGSCGGGKRYSRDLGAMSRAAGAMPRAARGGLAEESDEENDREVEQVFSKRYESSDSAASHSD